MNRQNVSKRNAELREDWFNTQPDPFLGMQLVVSRQLIDGAVERRAGPEGRAAEESRCELGRK